MSIRQKYEEKIGKAIQIGTPSARAAIIEDILREMRRDRLVPHLMLCAFLQDNAKVIREAGLR
jgi:hypothetical protein